MSETTWTQGRHKWQRPIARDCVQEVMIFTRKDGWIVEHQWPKQQWRVLKPSGKYLMAGRRARYWYSAETAMAAIDQEYRVDAT